MFFLSGQHRPDKTKEIVMARNVAQVLSGSAKEVSAFYAGIVEGYVGMEGVEAVVFNYTDRVKGITTERSATVVEIVGTPGMDSHGFKGMTDRGPRTFNFHLMG